MAYNDRENWQKILEGDEKSWRKLINQYQALIFTICINGGLSTNDAADCFQHTWLTLFKNRDKIKNPERLSAWLATTTKREVIRLRRLNEISNRQNYDNNQFSSSIDHVLTESTSSSILPDEELEILERQAILENALGQLDERCRQLLKQFFFAPENQTYEQIAAKLGILPNTLGPLRNRCLAKLKKILLKSGKIKERKSK